MWTQLQNTAHLMNPHQVAILILHKTFCVADENISRDQAHLRHVIKILNKDDDDDVCCLSAPFDSFLRLQGLLPTADRRLCIPRSVGSGRCTHEWGCSGIRRTWFSCIRWKGSGSFHSGSEICDCKMLNDFCSLTCSLARSIDRPIEQSINTIITCCLKLWQMETTQPYGLLEFVLEFSD